MTPADRQLIEWAHSQPGSSAAWSIAVGYLLKGKRASAKVKRECEATLERMRAERARSIGR